MRGKTTLSLGILLGSLLAPKASFAQSWTDFQVGDKTRKALVYVPSGLEKPPLLISLHGRGIGAGWHQAGMMKFEPIADREKFIVVYPDAIDGQWDLGGTSDLDFMTKIIDEMSAKYDIDLDRVYASGFSMGGMFSYTLACKMPDKIAAIVPDDGYPLFGESGCVDTRSVPIFHMHGTADDFVPYSGIHDFLKTKIEAYGCPTTAVKTDPYPEGKTESQSFKEFWGPCSNGKGPASEITLVSVTGMIHDWPTAGKANANEDPEFNGKPFDVDGSEETWAFLKNHTLKGPLGGSGGSGSGGASSSGGSSASGGAASSGAGGSGGSLSGSGGAPVGSGGDPNEGEASSRSGCSVGPDPGHRSSPGALALVAVMAGLGITFRRFAARSRGSLARL